LVDTSDAFAWVNYHTLSDFRITHLRALDELFTQVLGVLDAEGLISLERVTHDGTKIAANAARRSFCAEDRIRDALGRAREQVEALRAEALVEPTPNLRSQKAVERARRERVGRLELALTEFERIKEAKRPGYKKASKQQTDAVAGRAKRNGRWHSHKREARNTKDISTTEISRVAPEPDKEYGARL
jgi:hypothetical protein